MFQLEGLSWKIGVNVPATYYKPSFLSLTFLLANCALWYQKFCPHSNLILLDICMRGQG